MTPRFLRVLRACAPLALAVFASAATASPALPAPATAEGALALDCNRLTAADQPLLATLPAPRVIALAGSVPIVTMEPFAQFLIGMGYPEGALRDPEDGALSQSSYQSSETLAGEIAAYYEQTGLRPMLIGHSQGELAAATVAGILDRADAARVVARRSALLRAKSGAGAMLAVELDADGARAALAGFEDQIAIAAHNARVRERVAAWTPLAEDESVRLELDAPDGAVGWKVLYHSRDVEGNDIAVDATSIYWTARSGSLGGSVMRANKDGSGATPLISGITCPSDGGPSRIAIDDDHVYVTNYRCDNVMRVGKDGTGPTTLLTFPPGSGADYVVVSDDRIYVGLYFANKIMVANKDGSGLATLASSPTGRTVTMAIHGSDMFWTGFFGGPMLQRVSLGGGAITTLVPSGDGYGMALDADDVFIGTLGGALLKLPGGAGAPVQLASGTGWVDGIVPDEEHVYWSNAGNPGTIRRANKDGSGAVTLVAGLDMPFAMAADGDSIAS